MLRFIVEWKNMVFRHFRFQIIARILLICLIVFLFFYQEFQTGHIMVSLLLAVVIFYLILSLIRYIDKTNRDLTHFLQSIKHDDFSQTFDSKNYGSTFKELEESFTEVTSRFLKIRSESEENFRYLQTVVQHVGAGLISFQPDGEVELINTAAKRLFNISHLKNVRSLEKISRPLTEMLLKLKPGESSLFKLDLDNRTMFLSINATQFKLQSKIYTLVSLQDIQSEIERERMATELNIAYQVQKSLLPDSNPTIPGFDIAGLCIPAKETGGDYYDLIPLGGNKLGIVIADVSGKGVPAAIYMTLTKGIVQSHIHENLSPKDVLIKMNSLLYKTMERGNFVTMFFAVLDSKKRSVRCARAGHNEAIHFSHGTNKFFTIQPAGIGLGLEKGDLFRNIIQEQEIALNKDDILIFYTDGFTDAMNERREQFGEGRLLSAIKECNNTSMTDLIKSICSDVNGFVGNHSQFDDMTMIGIKSI